MFSRKILTYFYILELFYEIEEFNRATASELTS